PSPNPLRPLGGPHFALRRHAPSIHAWAALVRMQLGRRLQTDFPVPGNPLQWSRRVHSAEWQSCHTAGGNRDPASMEPPSSLGGMIFAVSVTTPALFASMEPPSSLGGMQVVNAIGT